MADLTGRTAFITGGSRGIGAAIAGLLAERGARIAITYKEQADRARAITDALPAAQGKALAVQMDIADAASVSAAIAIAAEKLGTIDILVNNAGTFGVKPFGDVDFEFYALQFNTNVWGTLQVTQAALRLFPERGGRIVNLSSQRAYSPKDGTGIYAASKAAISALTQAWAIELGPRGIAVNAVAPAVTRTDMTAGIPQAKRELIAEATPLRRLAEPSDIAGVVALLVSDDAGWITGRTILADGGFTGA